jgi:membrane protease subunit HflK
VRRVARSSEIARLAAPIARGLDVAWQRMHWWVATMLVLYAVSGTTIVKSDEVAVVLRWGRLVGDTPVRQEHGPGLLFSFPRPMDRVIRVPVKRVWEVPVTALSPSSAAREEEEPMSMSTLDPVTQGYALTGDRNVVHVEMVARYRVRDAAEWAFYGPQSDDVMRVEVTAAVVRSIGEMGVDRVLADGRKDLAAIASRRVQAGLDRARSGLELSSLEFTRLVPPYALATDFNAVQSAYISAETRRKEAQAFAGTAVPQAQGDADAGLQSARGSVEGDRARAEGEAAAFLALDREYRANPAVVRERLYRDAIERAIGKAGGVRWIPPPVNGKYNGLRITVGSGGQAPGSFDDEKP